MNYIQKMKDDCLLSFILLLDVCPLFNLIKWSGLWWPPGAFK